MGQTAGNSPYPPAVSRLHAAGALIPLAVAAAVGIAVAVVAAVVVSTPTSHAVSLVFVWILIPLFPNTG